MLLKITPVIHTVQDMLIVMMKSFLFVYQGKMFGFRTERTAKIQGSLITPMDLFDTETPKL